MFIYDEDSLYSKRELLLQASIIFVWWKINTVKAGVTLRKLPRVTRLFYGKAARSI